MSSKPTVARSKVISCAECRRLKLRCDRTFPCHNCVKRGLAAICPEGSLPTRPKMLLEETNRLGKKNAELSERIRLLEEGLASLQAGISNEVHPLLVKRISEGEHDPTGGAGPQPEVDEVNDSLGTLTIDQDGRSLFLGNTAGVESLFRESGLSSEHNSQRSSSLHVLHSLGIFSSLDGSKDAVMERLQHYLPAPEVAKLLTEVWFNHGAWLYNPISKSRFLDQVYNLIYCPGSEHGSLSNVTSHNTALLFIIFALGSFLSQDDDGAERYHQLARTALSCDAILVDPTMPAIRTLMLMAYYHLLCDKNGPQHCWAILGLASHMAQNIGLHRDSWRWKLDDAVVQERRALFWELYWLGINQCLSFGRPPSLILAYCDCEMPRSEDPPGNRPGEIKPGFHLRKLQFASECLSQVVEAVLGIKHTPYHTILALDRKVRDNQALKVPPNGATGPSELGAATVTLTLQRFMLKAAVEMTLLYLHRRYFARALNDSPENILGCRLGPSVLATYRSACMYITLMKGVCTLQPKIPSKFVVFWNHLLASSIVVGSVATKCPRSVLAPSAISELDACYALFESAAEFGGSSARPAKALAIVSRLRARAHELAAAIQAGALPETPIQGTKHVDLEHEPDELSILSGRGRLVAAKPLHRSKSAQSSPARSSPADNKSAVFQFQQSPDIYAVAHPLLLNNLRRATQQQTVPPRWGGAIWNDEASWEGTHAYEISPTPTLVQSDAYASMYGSSPAELGSVPDAAPAEINAPQAQYKAEETAAMIPQSWYSTPPPSKASPEEECHGGLGQAMSWDSNWQGYMQQLGVPDAQEFGP